MAKSSSKTDKAAIEAANDIEYMNKLIAVFRELHLKYKVKGDEVAFFKNIRTKLIEAVATKKKFSKHSVHNVTNSVARYLIDQVKADSGCEADHKLKVSCPNDVDEKILDKLTPKVKTTIKDGNGNQMSLVSIIKAIVGGSHPELKKLTDDINEYREKKFDTVGNDDLKAAVTKKFLKQYTKVAKNLLKEFPEITGFVEFVPKVAPKPKKPASKPKVVEPDNVSDSETEESDDEPMTKPATAEVSDSESEDEVTPEMPAASDASDDEEPAALDSDDEVVAPDASSDEEEAKEDVVDYRAAKKAARKAAKKAEKKAAKKAEKKAAKKASN